MRLGSGTISKCFLGTTEVEKIYLGTSVVYENALPPSDRMWSIDMAGEYTALPIESGIIWNSFNPDATQVVTPNGKTLSNMLTESNQASTLSVTNLTAFEGGGDSFIDYISSNPVYPKIAVDSGISLTDTGTLRFSGADPARTYDVYILTSDAAANTELQAVNGVQTVSKVSFNNLPTDGDNRLTSPALMKLAAVTPNGSGVFDIVFTNIGTYYLAVISLIIIKEI